MTDNYKVGDILYRATNFGMSRVKVERLTKTQVILSSKEKLNRRTGRLIGAGMWNTVSFHTPTKEFERKYEHEQLCLKIRNISWKAQTLGTLRNVYTALTEVVE